MTPGPRPEPLPELPEPFTLHDARRAGLTPRRLRASDLDRRVYGIRAAAKPDDDLVQRCRMFALRLPNEVFFSHSTAALLMHAPLPLHLERASRLHVTVPAPQRAPHAHGLSGHSRRVLDADVHVTRGVRHSSPARVWCELAAVLEVPDLVAVGDHLIHHRNGRTTAGALRERMDAGDRIARSPRLREAVSLLDDHAESRRESLLRVLLHRQGLVAAEINRVVARTETGRSIRCDFTFPRERVVVEYQGDYHRTRDQWRKDMTRRSRLEALGWYVIEVNADDLADPQELATRIRAVLARQRRLIALDGREGER
jgi:very-short-patch-repair endonuclease